VPPISPPRVFLLSPAQASGVRARLLLNPKASFALARQFQHEGVSLAQIFSFSSGLYFRGKITYATRFTENKASDLVRVITSNAGLLEPNKIIGPGELIKFGKTEIDAADPRYNKPLRRDAELINRQLGGEGVAILLGSIATPKYREVLLDVFGSRLLFPNDFVGRGDMSRGALLLRAAKTGQELNYESVLGAILTGKRARRIE
jgi:hypothetical protein